MNDALTQERLKSLLHYDPNTGVFTCIDNLNILWRAGKPIGWLNDSGYVIITIDKKRYRAHRLAMLYMEGRFPPEHTDHIDGNRSNNKYENLRSVTEKENHKNVKLRASNKYGFTGVGWHKKTCKWRAFITAEEKLIHLGVFESLIDAVAARIRANKQYNFHTLHGEKI